MPLVKTKAIVLTARPLGDHEKIVTLLTPQRGIIRVVAKGARRPKGRLTSGTVAYRVIEALIYVKEGRELGYLAEANVLWSAPNIGDKWRLFLIAGVLSETILAVTEDGGYYLLRTAIELLEGGIEPRLVTIFFFKGLLKDQGLWPDFTGCAVCDGDFSGGAALDTPNGRILCGRHRREGYLPINAGGVRLLNEVERRPVLKGRHADVALESALKACLSLAKYHFDLRLRSVELLSGAEHLLERTEWKRE